MIAFNSTGKGYDIKDLFLNQNQAEYLVKSLTQALEENKKLELNAK
jgi:hypothetical protein